MRLTTLLCLLFAVACRPAPQDDAARCMDELGTGRPLGYRHFGRVTLPASDTAVANLTGAGWDVTVLNGTPGLADAYVYLDMTCARPVVPGIDPEPPDPPDPPAGASLVTQSGFTVAGYWTIETGDSAYQRALAARVRPDGTLSFFTLEYQGASAGSIYALIEYTVADIPLGGTVRTVLNKWVLSPYFWPGSDNHYSLRWDAGASVLWFQMAADYPDASVENNVRNTWALTLADGGVVTQVRGPYGMTGVQERAVVGGVERVPPTFAAAFPTLGPYVSLGGQYASRMSYGVSLGLAANIHSDYLALPPTGGELAAGQFRVLANHGTGTTTTDWYETGQPTFQDRGHRLSPVNNGFDLDGTTGEYNWTTPAPGGAGRWPWGDGYFGTLNWLEWPSVGVYGLVGVLTAGTGDVYYAQSYLQLAGRAFEVHVFDPVQLAEAALGTRNPWNVQPVSMWVEPQFAPGMDMKNNAGMQHAVHGMTCLEARRQCYALAVGTGAVSSRVYVIDVTKGTAK